MSRQRISRSYPQAKRDESLSHILQRSPLRAATEKTKPLVEPLSTSGFHQNFSQMPLHSSGQSTIQPKSEAGKPPTSAIESLVQTTQSSGKSMPEAVQQKMEMAFGANFSQVRVHEGEEAHKIGALAYTQGNHIHFQPGRYNPQSQTGQQLLGHELAHVVQQRSGSVTAPQHQDIPINDDSQLETEADTQGEKAAQGKAVQTTLNQSASSDLQQAVQCKKGKKGTGKASSAMLPGALLRAAEEQEEGYEDAEADLAEDAEEDFEDLPVPTPQQATLTPAPQPQQATVTDVPQPQRATLTEDLPAPTPQQATTTSVPQPQPRQRSLTYPNLNRQPSNLLLLNLTNLLV
jgi:ribosomal protein S19